MTLGFKSSCLSPSRLCRGVRTRPVVVTTHLTRRCVQQQPRVNAGSLHPRPLTCTCAGQPGALSILQSHPLDKSEGAPGTRQLKVAQPRAPKFTNRVDVQMSSCSIMSSQRQRSSPITPVPPEVGSAHRRDPLKEQNQSGPRKARVICPCQGVKQSH